MAGEIERAALQITVKPYKNFISCHPKCDIGRLTFRWKVVFFLFFVYFFMGVFVCCSFACLLFFCFVFITFLKNFNAAFYKNISFLPFYALSILTAFVSFTDWMRQAKILSFIFWRTERKYIVNLRVGCSEAIEVDYYYYYYYYYYYSHCRCRH